MTCLLVIILQKASENLNFQHCYTESIKYQIDSFFIRHVCINNYYIIRLLHLRHDHSFLSSDSFHFAAHFLTFMADLLYYTRSTRLDCLTVFPYCLRKEATVHRLHWLKKGRRIDFEQNLWIALRTCSQFT